MIISLVRTSHTVTPVESMSTKNPSAIYAKRKTMIFMISKLRKRNRDRALPQQIES